METKKQNDHNSTYDILNEIVKHSSETFSKVARAIAMALCALGWAEFNHHRDSVLLKSALCIVIAYFAIELLQYFTPSIIARNSFKALREKEIEYPIVKKNMDRVSNWTMIANYLKLLFIIAITVLLFVYFVGQ